jgi:hypothetical protein
VRRSERQVDVARLTNRLAAVKRLEHGELARALLQDARDSVQVLRALGGRQVGPAVLERIACRLHREAHVLRACVRHLCQRLLAGGVDARLELAGPRLDELAPDEEPIALLEPDDLARLRRRRVLERGRDGCAILPFFDVAHRFLS